MYEKDLPILEPSFNHRNKHRPGLPGNNTVSLLHGFQMQSWKLFTEESQLTITLCKKPMYSIDYYAVTPHCHATKQHNGSWGYNIIINAALNFSAYCFVDWLSSGIIFQYFFRKPGNIAKNDAVSFTQTVIVNLFFRQYPFRKPFNKATVISSINMT